LWHSFHPRDAFLLSDLLLVAVAPTAPKTTFEVETIVSLATCKLRQLGRCNEIDPKAQVGPTAQAREGSPSGPRGRADVHGVEWMRN
jgi:hypothetical protein